MINIWLPAMIYDNFPNSIIVIGFLGLFLWTMPSAFSGAALICYGVWRKYERAQYRYLTI